MEEKKLRFWENWIVLGALLLYVINATQRLSNRLARDLELVGIESVIGDFDIFWNLYFPFETFAAFTFFAWFVFHNFTFPNFINKPKSSSGTLYFLFTIILSFVGVFMYHRFRLYWEVLNLDGEVGESLTFSFWSRKVFLAADTLLLVWVIFAYEICSVLFYKICVRLRKEGIMYSLFINFLFGLCILVFVFILGKSGSLANASFHINLSRSSEFLILGVSVVFCQNIFYQTLKTRKGFSAFFTGVFIVLVVCFVAALTDEFIKGAYNYNWTPPFSDSFTDFSDILIVILAVTLISLIIGFLRFMVYQRNNKLEQQVVFKSAELDQLRTQVNPHFLFNALNTLYSVSLKENAENTALGIQKLGDMMRFMLNENHRDFISLGLEVEQLENYIQIQRMRLDESQDIDVAVNLRYPESGAQIAPMILNPFVENAFKHGISFRNPSWIIITLTHDANTLYFKVHNSLHKVKEDDHEKYNHGIGLENVKKRLELIYSGNHTLHIESSNQDFFVSLTIKFR